MYLGLRRSRVAIAIATALTITGAGAAVAVATSSAPAGGSFRVLGVSSGTGTGGTVLLTGAIGDHGRSQSVNKAGKPASGGAYVKLTLAKGTLTLNKTKLDKAITKAFKAAKLNSATCSVSVAGSGPLRIVKSSGLYKGASGSARATVTIGFVLPRYTSGPKKGKCKPAFGKPVASQQIVDGTGRVSF